MFLPIFFRYRFIYEVREQLPKLRARLEQLRFRSAGRDSQLFSDLPVREPFDVVQHEYRACSGRQSRHGLLDGFGHERTIAVVFGDGGVIFYIDLELRDAPDLAQSVEGTIYSNPMGPCSELRIPAIAWQGPEDLHPHLL